METAEEQDEPEIETIARRFAAESTREGKIGVLLRNGFAAEEVGEILGRIEGGFSFFAAVSRDPGRDRIEVKAS